MIDPRNEKAAADDLRFNNPLSQEEDVCVYVMALGHNIMHLQSPWQQYFQDLEIRQTIDQDVSRTYPEMEFFHEQGVRTDLSDILFCYSRRNDAIGYRQGMHELLANVYYLVAREAFSSGDDVPGIEMLSPDDGYATYLMLIDIYVTAAAIS